MEHIVAILHTTPVTVAPLGALVREKCPGARVINWVDDSILPALMENPDSLPYAFEKLLCYARYAERQGAKIILSACSSVGEFQAFAEGKLSARLVRIDDPVSDVAVAKGRKIAVLATLETTLRPSGELLRRKGTADTVVSPWLVEGAYAALKAGDKAEHDRLIARAAADAASSHDVVYLAQASMADAVAGLAPAVNEKVLFSTGYAVDHLAKLYERL